MEIQTKEEAKELLQSDLKQNKEEFEKAKMQGKVMDAANSFINKWQKIPPLVRACMAGHLAQEHHIAELRDLNGALRSNELKLKRRAKVYIQFAEAYKLCEKFFVILANAADEEASASGLDALDIGEIK